MKHRVLARVNLDRIAQNYKHIQSLAGGARVMAVVKADAYGHGSVRVASELTRLGCTDFAVACLSEAEELREAGIGGNILILGPTDRRALPYVKEGDFLQTVDCYSSAAEAAEHALTVHIKVDTGMSRIGIYCHGESDITSAADEIEKISGIDKLKIGGIFTHFADSDGESEDFTRKQYGIFCALLDELKRRGIEVGTRHCCNSAATIRFPEMHLDMVRAGIILYGLSPSPVICDSGIAPAMKLSARICAIHSLRAGDSVSYGCTFTAERDTRVAVISIGYADGFSRVYSGKELISIGGVRTRTIGRICMDLCMVELTPEMEANVGDEAVIFETGEDIDRLANALGTINYEILCSLKHRVVIKYI